MRLIEILQAEAVEPLTPEQMRKRAERQRRQQQRIAAERARSALKVKDLQADLP